MSVLASWRTLAVAVLVGTGCASSHRPETFADPCQTDAECRAPFQCINSVLDRGSPPQLACTRACGTDSDCPDWEDEDDCDQDFRNSRCIDSVCVLIACEG